MGPKVVGLSAAPHLTGEPSPTRVAKPPTHTHVLFSRTAAKVSPANPLFSQRDDKLIIRFSRCATPNVLRFARNPAAATVKAMLGTGSPLLATAGERYRYNASSVSPKSKRAPSLQRQASSCDDQDETSSGCETQSQPGAAQEVRAKLPAAALVLLVGAATALSIWVGGGSWSIRG